MSSMPSPSTGMRLKPAASAASRASCTVASSSTVTMSGRGVITSRATVSPKSMMEWMNVRSSFSITFSSWATSAMALSSESVMNECVSSWLSSPPAPMMRLASPFSKRESHRMGGNRVSALTKGALSSAARSGFMTAQFLGTASKKTKITTTSKTMPSTTPQGPNTSSVTMPTSVADTSWHTNTSSRMGLRKLDGFSTSLASVRAPWRLSSTSDLALILLVRTRLVSAMASTPEPARSTAMITMRMTSSVWKPEVAKRVGTPAALTPVCPPGRNGRAAVARVPPCARLRRPSRGPGRAGGAARARRAKPPRPRASPRAPWR